MTTQKLFLVKAANGREATVRLPVGRYGGITPKGFKAIRERLGNGPERDGGGLRYALCLEAFHSAADLTAALESYKRNVI